MAERREPVDDATTMRDTVAGLVNLTLIGRWSTWVTRRSEVIDFPDRSTARRVTTVTVAPDVLPDRPKLAGAEWLPLTSLRKDKPGSIVVRDEAGALVPILNRAESEKLGGEILAALASALTDGRAAGDERLQRLIQSCATASAGDSTEATENLHAFVANSTFDALDRDLFMFLARDVSTNYFLFAPFSVADGRARRLLTYETRQEVVSIRRSVRDLPRLLGWTSTSIWLATPVVGTGAVYEVSIAAPDRTYVVGARMVTLTGERAATQVVKASPGLPVTLAVTGVAQNSNGVVAFDLAPSPSYIGGVLATAVLAAVVLTLGTLHVHTLVDRADAATTLLLAGPTLFAGLVAQPGRGSVGAQLLIAARGVLLLTGLLTFLAAATLVGVACSSIITQAWVVLTATAWTLVGILLLSLISPGSRRKEHGYRA